MKVFKGASFFFLECISVKKGSQISLFKSSNEGKEAERTVSFETICTTHKFIVILVSVDALQVANLQGVELGRALA
jgi:hypothetical protein